MPQKGITLFEMLVLAFVLIVAAALVVPQLTHTRHGGSRKTDCKNSLKQIGIYFCLYESKYKCYPVPGDATWFGQLWANDLATDGNLFRCAVRGKSGTGTHYNGITGPGSWGYDTEWGRKVYTWTASGISDKDAPRDLPMACDGDDDQGDPNHGAGGDLNVLFFNGRVDVFAIGSPTERDVSALLGPTTQGWAAPAGTR
ncbi:MAG: hypothetical protein FD180_3227 [Planctomycetota bacterium]|nr:MAG: hypothetical protein FD180_3227 [Planctomycetota bacterium]